MKKRIHEIDLFRKYPHEVQPELFNQLISTAKTPTGASNTAIGHINDSRSSTSSGCLVSTYEELYPYIERVMKGEANVLWPGKVTWFAKSSGTTNARSKYIPVTPGGSGRLPLQRRQRHALHLRQ